MLPDETSEGNRRDLLHGMFFPGGKHSSSVVSHGSASVRSASLDSVSNRVAVNRARTLGQAAAGNSRLEANKAAAAAMIGNSCKGKRICTVSDYSS